MTEEIAAHEVNLFQNQLTRANHSIATVRAYMADVRQFLAFLKDMSRLPWACTRNTLDQFMTELRAKGFTDSSIRRKISSIAAFLDVFVGQGTMSLNPTNGLTRPVVVSHPRATVTDEDVARMILNIDDSHVLGSRDRAMVSVLYTTGIKDYELLGLNISDVKFNESGQDTIIVKGKQGERVVNISKDVASCIRNYLLFRYQNALPGDERQRLFINKSGKPINSRSVRRKIEIYRQKAGILSPVTPSMFRNTCVSNMFRSGSNGEEVKKYFGYKLTTKVEPEPVAV